MPFSHTRIFNIQSAGSYTFYAMAQRGFEEEGNGAIYNYTSLHAQFYPEMTGQLISNKSMLRKNLILNGDLKIIDSIQLHTMETGIVEIRYDGGIKSEFGQQIQLAAHHELLFEPNGRSLILQAPDADVDRQPFVHTQSYTVTPGDHTYYILARHYLDAAETEVDLTGNFLVKFYPQALVSTNKLDSSLSFSVWPNPATSVIHIQTQETLQMDLFLYNSQGQLVKEVQSSGHSIDISSLLPGLYFLQVKSGNKFGVEKIIVE